MLSRQTLLLALTGLSGCAALIYELVWLRQIYLVFGVSYYAVATVFTTFLLGLAIGSYLGGKLVDRHSSMKKIGVLYAGVEFSTAFAALLVPLGLLLITPLLSYFFHLDLGTMGFNLVRFVLSLLVLIIPSTVIGMTFPIMLKFYSKGNKGPKNAISLLYFTSTIGGVVGVLLTGFVLIKYLGIFGSVLCAVILNLIVGVIVYVMSRKHAGEVCVQEIPAKTSRQMHYALSALFFVSGFIALAYYVIWSRLLALQFFTTIYAISVLFAVFLLGIALGSFAYSFMKKNENINQNMKMYVYVQLVFALFVPIALLIYTLVPASFNFGTQWYILFLMAFAVMFIPSLCFGVIFPLISEYIVGKSRYVGSSMGNLYAINTLGSIVGAFTAGFVFIPLVGLKNSLLVLALLGLGLACAAITFTDRKRHKIIAITAVTILVLLLMMIPTQFTIGSLRDGVEEVYVANGLSATVTVLRDVQGENIYHRLYVDNQEVAADTPVMMLDSKILAHLPLLLHAEPRSALSVGFGSGGTAYSMLTHQLDRVDIVEIEPKVVQAYPFFERLHNNALDDARLSVIIDDARSYVKFTDMTYDVISTDVTNLRYYSNANLYTKEYFELLRAKLNEGGIVSAWVPMSDVTEDDQKILMNTFSEVFPHMSVFYMYNKLTHFLVYIGTEEELIVDYDVFINRFNQPSVQQDLAQVGITPQSLVNGMFLDTTAVNSYTQGSTMHTDNHPVLEFPDFGNADHTTLFNHNIQAIFDRKIANPLFLLMFDDDEKQRLFEEEIRYEQQMVANYIISGHQAMLRQDFNQAAQQYAVAITNSAHLERIDVG